jgi:hypothetical protein
MNTSYPVTAQLVNVELVLPPRIASFYRWLHRWHSQTSDLHASTGYFARKQKVTERTIYRWLAVLRRLGYIQTEQQLGVERRITPVLEAPPAPPKRHKQSPKMSGVCQGSVSGVSSSIASDALDASTPDPEAVAALRAEGVPQPLADQVAARHGRQAVKNAVSAYRQTVKNVRNPVGWLVRAVEQRYQPVPGTASEGRRRASVAVSVPPRPVSVDGLQGKAAFDALRGKLALAGRV